MPEPFKKLNDLGINRFREYLLAGAAGPAPLDLLSNPETAEAVAGVPPAERSNFSDRYEFGCYLVELFSPLPAASIAHDQGLWSAAALRWFDAICPAGSSGTRDPDKEYRYILSKDYRHYYRHAVRAPWQLVRAQKELAKLLLISPRETTHPLSTHGEILEQFSGRQQLLGSGPVIAAANRLYFDETTGRPKKGVAGSGKGSARRFGLVLRQFELTFDPEVMTPGELIALLPSEFNRWKKSASASTVEQESWPGPITRAYTKGETTECAS
ncbi:hypothetical protein ACFPL7_12185 [Dongia soli]|uniref:Uncharacterized protein n=1 Tax=Dongia soli TaxID=600628 RepID=A0ABU5EGR6_9PROT|nr:hypothetical protein [Dongia soli]MDY0885428.1 hypothetical protein [Dongia soli]